MMANLISFIRPDMDKKRQSFELKSQILEHDTVISDGLHLQKILLNLLSNAMKYTQAGGTIRRLQRRMLMQTPYGCALWLRTMESA